MAVESRSTLWVDAAGNTTITRINSDGGFAGAVPALLACINADQLQSWEAVLAVNSTPAPTAAQYQPVNAVAFLVFTTTAPGVLVQLRLVAPKLSIFLADQRTIDLTNTDVAALITACIGVLSTESGDTATGAVAGYLG